MLIATAQIATPVQRTGPASRAAVPTTAVLSFLVSAVAVGVRRGVSTLQPHLVRPQAAPVVTGDEEPLVEGHAAGGRIGVDLGHPGAHAGREELVVPGAVERVGQVDPPSVPADLHHL